MKVEVKSTQTEETQCLLDGMTHEAYELMVKGKIHDQCSPKSTKSRIQAFMIGTHTSKQWNIKFFVLREIMSLL